MTNAGGKILKTGQWVQVLPANANRNQATVQNTSLLTNQEFDRNGINAGPPVWVYPFDTDPTTLAGGPVDAGAFLLTKPGDLLNLAGAATKAAIYIWADRAGVSVAASDY